MSSLPEPVERFVELVSGDRAPQISTLVLETDAWMWRPRLPPIPLDDPHVASPGRGLRPPDPHRPWTALDPVRDGRLCRRPWAHAGGAIGPGGPDLRRGRADRDVGRGPGLPERLAGPAATSAGRPSMRTRRCSSSAQTDGDVPLTVAFDSRVGFPLSCEADRHKGAGPRVRWTGRWSRWRPTRAGILAPSRMDVQWADEDRPWLELRVTSIELNGRVEQDLADARRALAGHCRDACAPAPHRATR